MRSAASSRRRVIAALGITQILAWGSSYYLPAVLAKPIAAATDWPLSTVVAGLSVALLASGVVSPFVGRAIDRQGGRLVLASSSALLAGGLMILAAAPALPVFFAGWLVIGVGMGAGLYDAAFSTLGRLYGAEARRAIASLTLWGGFASTICWPLSAALVEGVGWRGTCLAYAALQLGICLPLHLGFVPRQERSSASHRSEAGPPPAARGKVPVLVVLGGVLVLAATLSSVVSVHLLALLQARGLDLPAAVALGALIGPAQVAARLLEMTAGRRAHPLWTMAAATALIACGLVALLAGSTFVGGALVLYGAGNGIYSIARGTLPLALFGPHGYASLMGRLAMPALVASAAAPTLGAVLIGWGGAGLTLAVLAAGALANVALVAALGLMSRHR
jgi:predicted MFS family arabinose efflux permease